MLYCILHIIHIFHIQHIQHIILLLLYEKNYTTHFVCIIPYGM